MAFLGQHVHWTLTEVLNLDHAERTRWAREVSDQIVEENDEVAAWRDDR